MRFVALYSTGKDSILALQRMVSAGHEPVALLNMFNKEAQRSWFHGVNADLLEELSTSLGIPIMRCVCTGEDYEKEQESCLLEARALGAEAAIFGDIDIEEHAKWNQARSENAGLECIMPLWQQDRAALVSEFIELGYRAYIKSVDLSYLDESFLGKELDTKTVEEMVSRGSDACGENGEYHTMAFAGPLFSYPVPLSLGEIVNFGTHAAIDIRLSDL